MKIIFASFLLITSLNGFSQSPTKFYFDGYMHPASEKKAEIYGTGETDSGRYKLTCYYLKKRHPLACIEYFTDATQTTHVGSYQDYYENGKISTQGNYRNGQKEGLWSGFDREGKSTYSNQFTNGNATHSVQYFYLSDSHQTLVTEDNLTNNELYSTLYDAHNNVISKETVPENYTGISFNNDTLCSFPGGPAAWTRYVSQAIMNHMDELSFDDYGTVLLRFVVDSSGNISDVKPLTMKYSRLAMIAFNAVDSGPKWIPAEKNGKKVKVIRIQPVTVQNK
ncbi:MAG: energy transducer TonB [Ginsengibacter sp.]